MSRRTLQKFGFAVKQETAKGLQQSIQIFDQSGTAVTKVYLVAEQGNKKGSDQEAFDKLHSQSEKRQDGYQPIIDYREPILETDLEKYVKYPTTV